MNRKQTIALYVSAGVILLMLVFPPFNLTYNGVTFNMGYSFILNPPKRGFLTASVNYGMLLVQWLGVLILGGLAYAILGNRKRNANAKENSSNYKRQKESREELSSEELPPNSQNDTIVVLEQESEIDQSKRFLGGRYHPWRRYFARVADIFLFSIILSISIYFLVANVFPENFDEVAKFIDNGWILGILACFLWVPFEAVFLMAFGYTLGKWIFGIKVIDSYGKRLKFSNALERSFTLWIYGLCVGIPIVTAFTQYASYRRLTKTGSTEWDNCVGSTVQHKKWGVMRAMFCVIFICSIFASAAILKNL